MYARTRLPSSSDQKNASAPALGGDRASATTVPVSPQPHRLADIPTHSSRASFQEPATSSSPLQLMMGSDEDDDGKEDEASAKASSAPARARGPKGISVKHQDGTFYGDPSDVHIHDVGRTPHLKLGGKGDRTQLHAGNIERAYGDLLDHAAANSKARGVDGVKAWFAHHHAETVAKVTEARRAPPPQAEPVAVAAKEAPKPVPKSDDPYGFGAMAKGPAKPPDEDDFM